MSELKAFYLPRYAGQFTTHEVYIKSEADKVIAEKDEEIAELQKQVHDYGLGLYVMQARAEKEARYDKYKRCLAMADFWAAKAALLMVVRIGTNNDWYIKKYEIREQKWQELAEHYKEMAK